MIAYFEYRGERYCVSGWLWSDDGDRNGIIVSREDGREIRGAKMHPGMIQLGISDSLERAARRALEAQREAERQEGKP